MLRLPALPMRILFFMPHAGHARNFESTLRMLADRGHAIHVAMHRSETKDMRYVGELLAALIAEHPSIDASFVPARAKAEWPEVGVRLRRGLDYLRYLEPAYADAAKPRERAATRVPRRGPKAARARAGEP